MLLWKNLQQPKRYKTAVFQGLGNISIDHVCVDSNDNNGIDKSVPRNIVNIRPVMKPGNKRPNTDSQWKLILTEIENNHAMVSMSMIDQKNMVSTRS